MKKVVVIHGIRCNSDMMQPVANGLSDKYTVVNYNYDSTSTTIQEMADDLYKKVFAGNDIYGVVVHSMGGLLLKWMLKQHPEVKIARAVLLGVPNFGSRVANFVLRTPFLRPIYKKLYGVAGQQLVLNFGHPQLPREIEVGAIAGTGSQFIDLFFHYLVLPKKNDGRVSVDSAFAVRANDYLLVKSHHFSMLEDEVVITATKNFLDRGSFS